MERDETRTGLIKLLLRFSESIDFNDTSFKREMYNLILKKIKYKDPKRIKSEEDTKTIEEIIESVGNEWDMPEFYCETLSKKRLFSIPRQVAMTFAMDNTKMILESIGEFFGNRDHGTILHAHKTIDDLLETDSKLFDKFEKVKNSLGLEYKKYIPNSR